MSGLQVMFLNDGRRAKLVAPFVLFDSQGRKHEVPVDFVTDFASVPRFFWRLIPPWGPYIGAAVVHDWLYATHAMTRQEADAVFLDLMKQLSVAAWKRSVMYAAVRAFGRGAWDSAQARQEANREG